ncbi:hypothetical protein ANO11243_019470 [Dothideomycetidae sp. 11243]|nr:hypothetical protein ANO11243_019470 [fungal sp. No.11243]
MPPRLTSALVRSLPRWTSVCTRHHSTTTPPPPPPPLSSSASPISSSVSASEVSHFSTLASTWWDPTGPSALLHAMNPLRHQFISRCRATTTTTSTPSSTQTYLDIGCGGGIFAESAARLASTSHVTGLDPTPEVLAVAKAHLRQDPALSAEGKLEYRLGGVESLDAEVTADVVSVFEVVEHVNRPADFLQQCMRHVRPGGWLVGSTIARTWTSWFTTKFVAEDVLRLVPRGTHDWDKYILPEEMRAWAAKQAGWGDWRVMGVIYVPGIGWREVKGSEAWGNYFFALRRSEQDI